MSRFHAQDDYSYERTGDFMTSKPQDKECTALLYQAGCTATGVEKKRKLLSCSEHFSKIKQIKRALAEVITETDPKDVKTSEIFGHLTTAHVAIETASSLLAGNSRMQRTLTEQSGPECQLTMLERATIFHQWQANRTIQTCQTDEKGVK
jgi:hypothetical protein